MSERNEPVDPRHEDALSRALHAQAETVQPTGDGLVRIRARVHARRSRARWILPSAAVAAVAATVTAVVASGILVGPDHTSQTTALPPASVAASSQSSPTPSPAPASPTTTAASAPPVTTVLPSSAPVTTSAPVTLTKASTPTTPTLVVPSAPAPVWPFRDAQAAAKFQQGAATSPDGWHLDPKATAVRFIDALHLPHLAVTPHTSAAATAATADVSLTRTVAGSSKQLPFAVAHLARWGEGIGAPWGVVSITSPTGSVVPLSITSPTAGATVGSPLPVTFAMTGGSEDDVVVSAWATGGSSPLASGQTSAGAGATVTLSAGLPHSGRGYVVVADESNGGPATLVSRLAVTPVTFGVPTPDAPSYVAVNQDPTNGATLNVYDAATDAPMRPLAGDSSGVTQVAVSDDRQWAYYLKRGPGTCSSELLRTPMDGTGTPEVVPTAAPNVIAFGIAGPHAEQLTYATKDCTSGADTVHWSGTVSGSLILGQGAPPETQNVAISPDGAALAAFIRGGMEGQVSVFTTATAKALSDGTVPSACADTGGTECVAAAYAANGDLLVVHFDGQKFTVVRRHGTVSTPLFSVPGSSLSATLDVDPTGTKILLTDGASQGWKWSTSTGVKPLPEPVSGAAW